MKLAYLKQGVCIATLPHLLGTPICIFVKLIYIYRYILWARFVLFLVIFGWFQTKSRDKKFVKQQKYVSA